MSEIEEPAVQHPLMVKFPKPGKARPSPLTTEDKISLLEKKVIEMAKRLEEIEAYEMDELSKKLGDRVQEVDDKLDEYMKAEDERNEEAGDDLCKLQTQYSDLYYSIGKMDARVKELSRRIKERY